MFEMNENIEIITDFIKDSQELLDDVELDIISIDKKSESEKEEAVNKLFRTFHSIKGSAGFLGFNNVQKVAHAAENLLSKIRSGEISFLEEHKELFVFATDFLKNATNIVGEELSDDTLNDEAFTAIKVIENLPEQMLIIETVPSGDFGIMLTRGMIDDFIAETGKCLKDIEKALLEWISHE